MVAIQQQMEGITLPLLVLHGTADKVTEPGGSEDMLRRAKSSDKSLKLYPGLAHDLLHEAEHADVQREIGAFITARIAPGKAG
jgi:alpha-beta hydrolase superfamily lysophospholipase